jgi:hypothetical protein
VIKRRHRLDAIFQQRIHQPAVKIDSRLVDSPNALRQHARPRDTEAIRRYTQFAYELHVVHIAAVVVARRVTVVAARDLARLVRKPMPDAGSRTVSKRRAFDLIGARGRAPKKIGRKRGVGHVVSEPVADSVIASRAAAT